MLESITSEVIFKFHTLLESRSQELASGIQAFLEGAGASRNIGDLSFLSNTEGAGDIKNLKTAPMSREYGAGSQVF